MQRMEATALREGGRNTKEREKVYRRNRKVMRREKNKQNRKTRGWRLWRRGSREE